MRNPGESPEGRVQSETSSEGTNVPPSVLCTLSNFPGRILSFVIL